MHYYWVSNRFSGQRALGPAAGHCTRYWDVSSAKYWGKVLASNQSTDFTSNQRSALVHHCQVSPLTKSRAVEGWEGLPCGLAPLTLLQLIVHSSSLCPLLCNLVSGTRVLVQLHFLPPLVISSLLVMIDYFWRSHGALY